MAEANASMVGGKMIFHRGYQKPPAGNRESRVNFSCCSSGGGVRRSVPWTQKTRAGNIALVIVVAATENSFPRRSHCALAGSVRLLISAVATTRSDLLKGPRRCQLWQGASAESFHASPLEGHLHMFSEQLAVMKEEQLPHQHACCRND